MGVTFGDRVALGLLLKSVVADPIGSVDSLFDITFLEDVIFLVRVMRPHAGQIIRLKLQSHGHLIGHQFVAPGTNFVDLIAEAREILNVVSDLVRDHVGLRKIAGRLMSLSQLVEERWVNVNL